MQFWHEIISIIGERMFFSLFLPKPNKLTRASSGMTSFLMNEMSMTVKLLDLDMRKVTV